MASQNVLLDQLLFELVETKAVKVSKHANKDHVHFNFNVINSNPQILRLASTMVGAIVAARKHIWRVDVVCALPESLVPISSVVSAVHNIPMIILNENEQGRRLVRGNFAHGWICLLIVGAINSGKSILKAVESLRSQGLVLNEAIVIFDHGQSAWTLLEPNGIVYNPIISKDRMLQTLNKEGILTPPNNFLLVQNNQNNEAIDIGEILVSKVIPRIGSSFSQKLVNVMRKKKSNLCISVDFINCQDLLSAVELLGPKICLVKIKINTHLKHLREDKQMVTFLAKLKSIAYKYNFLIMEDYMFRMHPRDVDFVKKKLFLKPFNIAHWADFVTVTGEVAILGDMINFNSHGKIGAVMITEAPIEKGNPSFSSLLPTILFNIRDPRFAELVAGFASQSYSASEHRQKLFPYFLHFTKISLAQGINGVKEAVYIKGADVIVVGEAIFSKEKDTWLKATEEFRVEGWAAFENRLCDEMMRGLL